MRIKKRVATTGVQVLDIELARIGPHDYLPVLETSGELGARHVIPPNCPTPTSTQDRPLRPAVRPRAPLGLAIDLELPSWIETPNLTEARRGLGAANRPDASILIDLLHFARSGSSLAELRWVPPEWFHFAHVCDARPRCPPPATNSSTPPRCERLLPVECGIDTRGILAAVPRHPYALEIPHATRTAR